MTTLICGSIAYDSIMVFEGRFADHILPHQVHILNVSFLVPDMRREFGGCAGNISYNLKLLGGEPLPMATVGSDAQPYMERLDALGISPGFAPISIGPRSRSSFFVNAASLPLPTTLAFQRCMRPATSITCVHSSTAKHWSTA